MISYQPSCVADSLPPSEDMLVCKSSKDSRMVKGMAGKGQATCKHVCEHHPELVDRWLWRKLPFEMVELVIAKLPFSCIIDLCGSTEAWKSSNFREACSEKHAKPFGLMVYWGESKRRIEPMVYDIDAKKWLLVELATLPEVLPDNDLNRGGYERLDITSDGCRNSMYACDGGLVCFVPNGSFNSTFRPTNLKSCPILVCNPSTSTWKTLPLIPLDDLENTEIIMVQLDVEEDTTYIRVILVIREKIREPLVAHLYDSQTGKWSSMDSGLVCGADNTLYAGPGVPDAGPYVIDCPTKTFFDLRDCVALDDRNVWAYSMAKDQLFVLYQSNQPNLPEHGDKYTYAVSEYIWESSSSDLKELNSSRSNVQFFQRPYKEVIFAGRNFVLLFADNCEEGEENHHQLIGLYDVSANEWDIPSRWDYVYSEELQCLSMCELRWDITPWVLYIKHIIFLFAFCK